MRLLILFILSVEYIFAYELYDLELYELEILVIIIFIILTLVFLGLKRRKELLIESIVLNLGEGVYGVDKNGKCIWINKSALNMLGFEEDEVVGKKQHFLFHYKKPNGEIYLEETCPLFKTQKDKKTRSCQEYFIRKDGTIFPVYITVSSSENNSSIVVFRNNSVEIKKNKILKEKEEQLDIIFKTFPDSVTLFDPTTLSPIKFNKKAYTQLGYRKEEYSKLKMNDIGYFDTEFEIKNKISNVLNRNEYRFKTKHICKKGNLLDTEVSISSISISDKQYILSVCKDITHVKRYEELLEKEIKKKTLELEKINQGLEDRIKKEIEKNRQKDLILQNKSKLIAMGEMLGNIAHQWRQPLSAITTATSGLKLKNELNILEDNDIDLVYNCIMKNATYLSDTIEDFRNFFKKEVEKKLFSINESIEKTINIMSSSFIHNNIDLNFYSNDIITYNGNSNLLVQVLVNILSNAKDAFNNKEIELKTVSIILKKERNYIIIEIYDNAGGINEEIIEKIFDPYFTTKHQSQGTGLGLYMSYEIIQKNFNGTLSARNYKKGASFNIKIPLAS